MYSEILQWNIKFIIDSKNNILKKKKFPLKIPLPCLFVFDVRVSFLHME